MRQCREPDQLHTVLNPRLATCFGQLREPTARTRTAASIASQALDEQRGVGLVAIGAE